MFGDKMNEMFSKPQVLKAMAGIGKGLDPEGAGGYLGDSAQALLAEQAKMRAQDEEKVNLNKLVEALSKTGSGSSITQKADGTVSIKSGSEQKKEQSKLGGLETPGLESYFSGLESFIDDTTADLNSSTGQEVKNTFKNTLSQMKSFFNNF